MSATTNKGRDTVAGSGPSLAATGCRQASFNVDPSGQATYTIPIDVPPGIASLQPKLAFCYSHRQSDNIMGVGWSLSGLSSITRLKATYAIDGFNGGVNYDDDDRYALDGQRLINIQGDYGQPNTVYYTEMQSWQYIQAGASENYGFTVTQKNGQVCIYGGTSDSRIMASGGEHVRVWAISSIEDLNGNKVLFSYTQTPVDGSKESGAYYLDTISYTVRDGISANRFVKCLYESRPDPISTYIGGYPVLSSYRMTQLVTLLADDTVIRTYSLSYRTSNATQLSCIESITESGAASAGAPSLPATQLVWQDIDSPGFDIGSSSTLDQHSKPLGVQAMDVNGDGCTDIVQLWQDTDNSIHATVYLATSSRGDTTYVRTSDTNLGTYSSTRQIMPMDVTGDGRTDLVIAYQSGSTNELKLAVCLSDGQGFTDGGTFDTGEVWDTSKHIDFYPVDVNGDGRTDLVEAYRHYDPNLGNLLYFRSWISMFGDGGDQLFTDTIVSPTQDAADLTHLLATWPLDVNGDGMTDIVRVWQRGSDSHIIATAYLSVSTGIDTVTFAKQVDSDLGTFSLSTQLGFFPADVNGDGMTDLLQIWQESSGSGTTLHLSSFICNGAGGFVAGPDSAFANQTINKNSFYPMGFNGGGQTNILNKWISGDNKLMFTVYSSTPAGQFFLATDFDAGTAGSTVLNASFFAGDANGDGKADLIRVSASQDNEPVIVPYFSAGPYPDMVSSITNPLGGVTSIQYAPITDDAVYTVESVPDFPAATGLRYPNPLTPAQFPVQTVLGQALYVVSAYTQSDDSSLNRFGYSASYVFNYTNAQVDMLGRGWQGFASISKLNLTNGCRNVQLYNQDYPQTGTLAATRIEADGQYATDPRVPASETALLMSITNYTYETFVRATGATDSSQQVVEVLKTAAQTNQYNYGESNFDYAIGMQYGYDDYGNQDQYVWLGYVDQNSGSPLNSAEVVYQYSLYQNDLLQGGWALGYLLYQKTTANATNTDITAFQAGDYQLEKRTYTANTYNLETQGKWDNSNNVYLTTSYTYDDYGNQQTVTQPGGFVTTYAYETDYNTYPMLVTLPVNQQGVQLSTGHGYDPRYGIEVATSDANNFIFITALDAFGRKIAEQGPVPAGTQSDINLVTSLVTGSATQKTSFQSAIVVSTTTTQYLNDGSGGNYTQVNALQSFPTDSSRDILYKQSFVDGQNRERQSILQSGQTAGNIMVLTDYNSDGKIINQTLPFFSTDAIDPESSIAITYTYDVVARKLTQQQPAGADGTESNLSTWYYGSDGMVTQTDASGTDAAYVQVFKHHFYNSKDQVVQSIIQNDSNATTNLTYDAIARTLSMTDPATASNPDGVRNAITYDSLDRKQSFDNPDQNTTGDSSIKAMTYVYDGSTGFLSSQANAAQQAIVYTYDSMGRVLTTSFADGRCYQYTYDNASVNGNSKLTQVKVLAAGGAPESQQDFSYDAYGNNTGVTLTIDGESTAYTTATIYDPQKRIVQQTLPDSSVNTCTYTNGVLTSQVLGDARIDYPLEKYTALGKFGETVYGSGTLPGDGIVTDYQFNPMGLLYGETVQNNTGNLVQLSYSYDALNQILGIADQLDSSQSQSFTYLNKRLATAIIPGFANSSYSYDASGNITSKDGASYTYHAHFPLTMTRDGQTIYSATQDACGNTLTRVTGTQSLGFTYNTAGNLVSILSDGVTLQSMLYDYTGRRIKQTKDDGTVTLYISANYQVERNGTDTTVTKYLSDSLGAAAAIISNGGNSSTLYYRRDHKGSITLTFGSDGTIVSQMIYDGYGLSKLVSGPDDFTLTYEQRTWDGTVGLYYFGARYYDPVTGRFLTPDSSLGGSSYLQADVLNRFAFELNNPINQIDPTGHMAKWIGGLLLGLTILVIGVALIATAGAAAAAIAPGIVAGAAFFGATVSTAAATSAASALITIAGSAAIAAGISATSYSGTHKNNFDWTDYWIQTGISAGVGAVTGGLFLGLSALTAGIQSSIGYGLATVAGSGLISAGGDVTGQFFTNLAEGATGHDLANGLWQAAAIGFGFGAAGALLGMGFDKATEKITLWRKGVQIQQNAINQNQSEFDSLLVNRGSGTDYTSYPRPVDELVPELSEKAVKDVMSKPLVRTIQVTVGLSASFPEGYLENEEG